MKFSYEAFNTQGKPAPGIIEAPNAAEAADRLRKQGLFVTSVQGQNDADGPAGPGRAPAGPTSRGGGAKGLATFARQMQVLVSTGTPVVESLCAIERQTTHTSWHSVLEQVRTRVEEGAQLSDAMAAFPRCFDPVTRSLIAAGESGGKLGSMLERVASITQRRLKVRGQLIGAMVYPCVLVCVSIGVLCLMIGFVMPRFEGLFKTLDAPLPPTTKLLMSIGVFMRLWWWAVLLGVAIPLTGLVMFLRTEAGKLRRDTVLVKMPQIGRVTRAFTTARFARVLGVLLDGRVAMLDALRLTRQSTGNRLYAAAVVKAEEAVTRGENVSAALAESKLIAPSICEAIRSGERTGQMAPVLLNIADFMDEDNEVLLKSLTQLMEPLILVVLGVVVGFVAMSMFMPLFDLTAAGGGA